MVDIFYLENYKKKLLIRNIDVFLKSYNKEQADGCC